MTEPATGQELAGTSRAVRRWRAWVVPVALSLAMLGAVVWWALRQEPPRLPPGPRPLGALALAVVLYVAATLARGQRWLGVLRNARVAASREDAYALTTVGYMGNNVLPARGGDVLRILLLAPVARVSRRCVLGTVVAERLLDVAALVALFAALAWGLGERPAGDMAVSAVAVAAVAAVLTGLIAVVAVGPARERAARWLAPVFAAMRGTRGRRWLSLFCLSLAIWALEAAVYLAVAEAVGLGLGPAAALYVVALTNLFALLPAAPGYVGTFDAAVVVGVTAFGASGAEALSFLLLLRFVLFVPITLVGFAILTWRYGGWASLARWRAPARGA